MCSLPRETRKEEALKKSYWFLILAVFFVDRLLKIWVVQNLSESQGIPIVPGLIHLTRVSNTGAAFGLWRDAPYALAVFSALSIVFIIAYLAGRFGPVSHAPAWALVAGGAMGNLYDRLRFGYVVDYVDLRIWPVFNFADTCISLSIVWILFSFLKKPGNGSHVSGPS